MKNKTFLIIDLILSILVILSYSFQIFNVGYLTMTSSIILLGLFILTEIPLKIYQFKDLKNEKS